MSDSASEQKSPVEPTGRAINPQESSWPESALEWFIESRTSGIIIAAIQFGTGILILLVVPHPIRWGGELAWSGYGVLTLAIAVRTAYFEGKRAGRRAGDSERAAADGS